MIRQSVTRYQRDQGSRLSAALAYYTAFSLAPLLVIVISVTGFVLGPEAAQGVVAHELTGLVGESNARVLQDVVRNLDKPRSGLLASVVGLATLFLGAMRAVGELQSALNRIWNARGSGRFLRRALRSRFTAALFVLSLGFLLLVSMVLSAVVSAVGKYFSALLPIPAPALQAMNLGATFCVDLLLFAMIYKLLPEVRVAWRDVWTGSSVTSVLFTLGNFVLGFYLGRNSLASAYGAAGSLILILLWTYYCAQILYFGAEFTFVYAHARGSMVGERE